MKKKSRKSRDPGLKRVTHADMARYMRSVLTLESRLTAVESQRENLYGVLSRFYADFSKWRELVNRRLKKLEKR